jgi:hypothetical protein
MGVAMRGVNLFCGISETKWNYHPVSPGGFACISPVKGASERTKAENRVFVPSGTLVGQDSGAFQDSWGHRLSFQQALDRQRRHAEKYRYAEKIVWRVSYDVLIDEVWQDGGRSKKRWTVEQAKAAVAETIAAAAFLQAHNSEDYPLCLSVQGVDSAQYMECAKAVIPMLDLDRDTLGLGGWCIIGKMPKVMMPVFEDTILQLVPYAANQGVKRLHIFGVIYPNALGKLLFMTNRYGLELSTDSASPCMHPIFGEWGYGEWRNNGYSRPPVEIRGQERARHVRDTRAWLENLHCTSWHKEPVAPKPKKFDPTICTRQLNMFEEISA